MHGLTWSPVGGHPDLAEIRADWREGQRRGVNGSPHFLAGGKDFFCPSLDIGRVDGHLHVTFDEVGFTNFEAACLAPVGPF